MKLPYDWGITIQLPWLKVPCGYQAFDPQPHLHHTLHHPLQCCRDVLKKNNKNIACKAALCGDLTLINGIVVIRWWFNGDLRDFMVMKIEKPHPEKRTPFLRIDHNLCLILRWMEIWSRDQGLTNGQQNLGPSFGEGAINSGNNYLWPILTWPRIPQIEIIRSDMRTNMINFTNKTWECGGSHGSVGYIYIYVYMAPYMYIPGYGISRVHPLIGVKLLPKWDEPAVVPCLYFIWIIHHTWSV